MNMKIRQTIVQAREIPRRTVSKLSRMKIRSYDFPRIYYNCSKKSIYFLSLAST